MGAFNIFEHPHNPIRYGAQAEMLFNVDAARGGDTLDQQVIPFLGAGVSLSEKHKPPSANLGDGAEENKIEQAIDDFCRQLGVQGDAAHDFIRMAAVIARRVQAEADNYKEVNEHQFRENLVADPYPPSVSELTRLFSTMSLHTTFTNVAQQLNTILPGPSSDADKDKRVKMLRLLAAATGIANPPDSLTSITSYFESSGGGSRQTLWKTLHGIFAAKKKVTATHRLVAAAAHRHIREQLTDYLIITSNYDCLMEEALDQAQVKYVAVTTRKKDQEVIVRFSANVDKAAYFQRKNTGFRPKNMYLQKGNQNLVVLYKIHGCLNPGLTFEDDCVIISDNDYVNYLSHVEDGHGAIPAFFNTEMHDKAFLFLGYSLTDWNVRSMFETIRRKRGEDFAGQDYSVMNWVGDYEKVFFQKNLITILRTDLSDYVEGHAKELRELLQTGNEKLTQLATDALRIISG